jgi:hypothetical protein
MSEAQPIKAENPRDFDLLKIAVEFIDPERSDYAARSCFRPAASAR